MMDRNLFGTGLKFTDKLRFRIEYLEIKIGRFFLPFPELEFPNPKSPDTTYKVEQVLFDTGNEANYNVLADGHFEQFKGRLNLKDSDFIPRDIAYVTKEPFMFRFDKTIEFVSQIGFYHNCPENWYYSINIGMNSIIQFISVIYPSNSDTEEHRYYYKQNSKL